MLLALVRNHACGGGDVQLFKVSAQRGVNLNKQLFLMEELPKNLSIRKHKLYF